MPILTETVSVVCINYVFVGWFFMCWLVCSFSLNKKYVLSPASLNLIKEQFECEVKWSLLVRSGIKVSGGVCDCIITHFSE